MKSIKDIALKIILVISIIGIVFSGFLSYKELSTGASSCSAAAAGTICSILGIPVCVFGLIMYLIIFIVSLWGMLNKK